MYSPFPGNAYLSFSSTGITSSGRPRLGVEQETALLLLLLVAQARGVLQRGQDAVVS